MQGAIIASFRRPFIAILWILWSLWHRAFLLHFLLRSLCHFQFPMLNPRWLGETGRPLRPKSHRFIRSRKNDHPNNTIPSAKISPHYLKLRYFVSINIRTVLPHQIRIIQANSTISRYNYTPKYTHRPAPIKFIRLMASRSNILSRVTKSAHLPRFPANAIRPICFPE